MKKITLSVYVKYLISYAIAFVIPLLVLGGIMFLSFSHLLKGEIDRNSLEMLSSAQTVIDARIEEMNNTAIQISNTPTLRFTEVSQSFTNAISAVNHLRNIALTNKFYDDIFVYYHGSELIYAASGTYRTDYFLKYIYMFEKWNTAEFLRDMKELSEISVRPSEKLTLSGRLDLDTKYVTYMVPLPYGSKTPIGAVIFIIHENKFGNNLKKALNLQKGNVLLLSPQGQPVISYGDTDSFDLGRINPKVLEGKSVSLRQTIRNKSYSISGIRSDLTGWTYIVLFPVSEVYAKMAPILTIVLLGFAILVSVGFAAIYLLTRANYKPIRELVNFALDAFGQQPRDSAGKNEIETVKTAVNKMTGVIHTLQKKVETSIPGIRNTLLTKLVKGYYPELEVFRSEASEAGVHFHGDLFGIAVFIVHCEDKNINSWVMEQIESRNTGDVQLYCVDGMDQNRIVAVYSIGQMDADTLFAHISCLSQAPVDSRRFQMTSGIGNPVPDIKNLGNSYLEASAALDYRFIKGKNSVILYSELEIQSGEIDYYPKEKLEILGIHIMKADSDGVLSILSDIFEEMKSMKLPVFYARSLSYNLINSIFDSIYRMKGDMSLREYKYSDITSLARLETIDELSVQIGKFCMLVCSVISQNKNGADRSRAEQIRSFITGHFTDVDFSLQTMAEHFSMSVSGLSSYFKAATGENISEYVNRLRIDYAKKLLVETDDSLQTIVHKIGYMNVSSFIRKFREYTHATPGDYRSLMKGDS